MRREKKYVFLLIFVLVFFGLAHFLQSFGVAPREREAALEESIRRLDELVKVQSQNPMFLERRFSEDPFLGWLSKLFTIGAFVALLAGIYVNLELVQKTIFRRPWLLANRPPRIRWGIGEVMKVIILFFFYGICLNLIFLLLEPWFSGGFRTNFLVVLHGTITDLIAVGLIVYFVKKLGVHPVLAFGFRSSLHWLKEMWFGVKAYFGILPLFLIVLYGIIFISNQFHYEPPSHPLVGIFIEEETRAPWLVVYSLFLACVFGPIVEEIFFRGFLYPAIRKKGGVVWATSASAALFALVHNNWFAFVPIFLLGSVLAYLYEKRGNLVSCITLHIVHNSAFIFYFFLIKQIMLNEGVS